MKEATIAQGWDIQTVGGRRNGYPKIYKTNPDWFPKKSSQKRTKQGPLAQFDFYCVTVQVVGYQPVGLLFFFFYAHCPKFSEGKSGRQIK
jgi:hypothetical protein